jgi:hypothetical protein
LKGKFNFDIKQMSGLDERMASKTEWSDIGLNIYGFKINLRTSLAHFAIRQDFSFFESTNHRCDLFIEQFPLHQAPKTNKGVQLGKSRMCTVFQTNWRERTYLYLTTSGSVSAIAKFESKTNKIQIYTDNEDLFFEISYMMILSLSGEFLEKKRIMRLHALSFAKNQKTFCLWGKRKAGKSTLAQTLVDQDSVHFFSDEISLYDMNSEKILPFPIRIGLEQAPQPGTQLINLRFPKREYLDQKFMYDIPPDRISRPSPLNQFVVLEDRKNKNQVCRPTFKERIFFLSHLLLGTGLIPGAPRQRCGTGQDLNLSFSALFTPTK